MNWQLVIAFILLSPLAALSIAVWLKWTLHVWKGRDDWFSWVIVNVLVMALAGVWLLLEALEVQP